MNRRQKKKFIKKCGHKKYQLLTMLQWVGDRNDLLNVTFHNGSYKVHEAIMLTNVYPISCSSNITYTRGNDSDTMDSNNPNISFMAQHMTQEDSPICEYLNAWIAGVRDT